MNKIKGHLSVLEDFHDYESVQIPTLAVFAFVYFDHLSTYMKNFRNLVKVFKWV